VTLRYTVAAPRALGARELRIARLWAAGALGVWERGDQLVAWFDQRVADPDDGGGSWDQEPDRDWQAAWKAGIEPVIAGQVAVVPTWLRDAAPQAAHVIELDPGQAFGTGHHATTVLCLELLQDLDVAGARVLDVGTGTGVLAIAAAKLGASHVRAVDIDADAVGVAERNARANGIALELATGSISDGDHGYDVVLANLLTDTVARLAAPLVGALSSHGTLIASGITVARAGGPRRALTEAGAVVAREERRDGWLGLAATRALSLLAAMAVLLAGCTDPELDVPADQPAPASSSSPGAEAPDPRRDELVAEVRSLTGTLAAARDALTLARDAADVADVAAARAGAEAAVHTLTAHPGWAGDLDGDGAVRPLEVSPLLPGPGDAIPEDAFYGDQFSRTLTAARAAGAAGNPVVDALRDPVVGDLGVWQADTGGILALVDQAADPSDLAAVEAATQELPGSATRALTYALTAVRARDLPTIATATERALAHLDLTITAIHELALTG